MICSHRNPGRCRPVRRRGIVGLLETWGMQVHWGMNVVLLSECGCAGMRGGHIIAPTDGWSVKRQEAGAGGGGREPVLCHGCMNYCMCIYFALQKPQANELSSGKKKEKKVCSWNIQTSSTGGKKSWSEDKKSVPMCPKQARGIKRCELLFLQSAVSLTGAAIPTAGLLFLSSWIRKLTSQRKINK